jgi:tetratricopeptide (TPR) repeat protein
VSAEQSAAGRDLTVHGDVHTLIAINSMSGDVRAAQSTASPLPIPQELLPEVEGFHNHDDVLQRLTDAGFDEARTEALVGVPGSGKTSLAIHWANLVTHRFVDGRIYLNLRGSGTGREKPLEVHDALGQLIQSLTRQSQDSVPADTDQRGRLWRSLSHERKLFILLDNAVDADQVAPLLPNGPHTVTMVTSRNALTKLTELRGVRITTITPLTPDESVAMLRHLLGEHVEIQDDELRELARLCGHLQLALRVAATRLLRSPLLTAADLIEELTERGTRVMDPVRAVFESAHQQLQPESARLFRLLGAAPGSILSVDSVVALAGGRPRDAKDLIQDLAQSHLLVLDKGKRCVMHDLLQAYAAQLADAPDHQAEVDAGLTRLGKWYATRATHAALALGSPMRPHSSLDAASNPFSSGRDAQDWYRDEAENLAIMVTTLADRHMFDTALMLCQATVELRAFNNAKSWKALAEKGLQLAEAFDDLDAQAFFHESLGKSYAQSGQPAQAVELHAKALDLRLQTGDLAGQARSLNALGLAAWRLGDLGKAEQTLNESLARAREAAEPRLEALALMNLGLTALSQAEQSASAVPTTATTTTDPRAHNARALALLDEALQLLDPDTQAFYATNALYNRARALSALAEHTAADATAQQAVAQARDLGNDLLLAPALRVLATTKTALGDTAAAEQCLTEALEILHTLGDTDREARFRSQLEQLRSC